MLTVPLLDTQGEILGMFGVLDRLDGAGISPEDVRRARALAAQVAIALEATRNLHQSEQHRRRAESLTELALELKSHLKLPEFVRSFAGHAVEFWARDARHFRSGRRAGSKLLLLHDTEGREIREPSILRRFTRALEGALAQHEGTIVSSRPPNC